jgi:TusA-related sulfurtransferase
MSRPKPDRTLDVRGQICPMPVIETSRAIKEMDIGQVLEVLTSDPNSRSDIKAWSRMTGNELLYMEEEPSSDVYRFYIRKVK